MPEETLAARLAAARRAAGLSAQKLSDRMGGVMSRGVIANIECGAKKDASVAEVAALAKALGVPFFQLAPEAGGIELAHPAYWAGYNQAVEDMRAFGRARGAASRVKKGDASG